MQVDDPQPQRMDNLQYAKPGENPFSHGAPESPFFSGPAEFMVAAITDALIKIPEWRAIFGENIDPYKRDDYNMRQLPALRIYNELANKQYESWFIEGPIKADMILPAVLRRKELQQVQDTLSMALLQQFRRPTFFDQMGRLVPGLNELGKQFSVDKTLGFEWGDDWVPVTQIVINFKIDQRIWDDYLELTDRTKDSPFTAVLSSLKAVAGTIKALQDDLVTTDVELGVGPTAPGTGPTVQGDE